MKAHEALIAWTPRRARSYQTTVGQVKVGLLRDDRSGDWTEPFASTGGAAMVERRKWRGEKSLAQVFIEFHTLVVRDGIDPEVAHQAFLAIDEYAEAIAPDIPGARDVNHSVA